MVDWVKNLLVDVYFFRYFLRKLKKVKKSNGQMLAINEVMITCICNSLLSGNKDIQDWINATRSEHSILDYFLP